MAGPAKKPSKEEVKAMIKFKKEKKKLDDLLKKGKISQGAYQRRLQKIAPKGAQIPGMHMAPAGGMAPPMAPMPGGLSTMAWSWCVVSLCALAEG